AVGCPLAGDDKPRGTRGAGRLPEGTGEPMSFGAKLRRGNGPVWGRLKRLARRVLSLHIPAAGPARPLFRLLYRAHVAVREGLIWAGRFFWFEPLFRSQCGSV